MNNDHFGSREEIIARYLELKAQNVTLSEENNLLRRAGTAIMNFSSHPGGHPADKSDAYDEASGWREGWIVAVEAMQDLWLEQVGKTDATTLIKERHDRYNDIVI